MSVKEHRSIGREHCCVRNARKFDGAIGSGGYGEFDFMGFCNLEHFLIRGGLAMCTNED